jgi:hypothetical protein
MNHDGKKMQTSFANKNALDILLQFFIAFPPFSFWFFIALPFAPCFYLCFVSVFQPLWVSSLAYPNLLGSWD